jgi:5-methylcytosine-specific restriction endonuclease McrA
LRSAFRYWLPALDALNAAKFPYKGSNKRQKWEFKCAECKKMFKRTEVEIDHKIPVGSLKCDEDLIEWLHRLTPESSDAYQVVCKECHREKTNRERKDRK